MKHAITIALSALVLAACGSPPPGEDELAELEALEDRPRLDGVAFGDFNLEAETARVRAEEAGLRGAPPAGRLEELEELPPRPRRRVRRWRWEAPSETRSRLWALPEEETVTATATGLLRVCTAEADFDGFSDCSAIWEVVQNVRSRRCARDVLPRITECDGDGETELSALRRLQRVALGVVPPRSRRSQWIAELSLDCDRPPSFGDRDRWERRERPRCERLAELVLELVDGSSSRRPTTRPAIAIAWGGRCEDAGGACDDPLACARGLARIPETGTRNAFWCRPGSRGCAPSLDPICYDLGVVPEAFRREGNPGRAELEGGGDPSSRPGRGNRSLTSDGVAVADRSFDGLAGEAPEAGPVFDEGDPVRELHRRGGGLER